MRDANILESVETSFRKEGMMVVHKLYPTSDTLVGQNGTDELASGWIELAVIPKV